MVTAVSLFEFNETEQAGEFSAFLCLQATQLLTELKLKIFSAKELLDAIAERWQLQRDEIETNQILLAEFVKNSQQLCLAEQRAIFPSESALQERIIAQRAWNEFLSANKNKLARLCGKAVENSKSIRICAAVTLTQSEWFTDTQYFSLPPAKRCAIFHESPIFSMPMLFL